MAEDWNPEELKNHLDKGESVFLKLWQKGCGPCTLSKPAVERLEQANRHNLVFAQICVDDYPEMMDLSGSEVLPAFFIFKDKQLKSKFLGFKGLKKLEEFVDDAMR